MLKKNNAGLTFYKREAKISKQVVSIILMYAFIIFIAIVFAVCFVFGIGIKTSMVGYSMEPCLYNGQEVLIDRIIYNFSRPKRGDVIVFKPNGNENSHFYIKRVVGVPGDKIQINDGVLFLNGHAEPLMFSDKIEDEGVAFEEIEVANDEYFVMGDNCNNSEDSRSANLGNVNISTVYGKAWFHIATDEMGMGVIK